MATGIEQNSFLVAAILAGVLFAIYGLLGSGNMRFLLGARHALVVEILIHYLYFPLLVLALQLRGTVGLCISVLVSTKLGMCATDSLAPSMGLYYNLGVLLHLGHHAVPPISVAFIILQPGHHYSTLVQPWLLLAASWIHPVMAILLVKNVGFSYRASAAALDLVLMLVCLSFTVYRKEAWYVVLATSLLLVVRVVQAVHVFGHRYVRVPDEMCIVLRYMTRGDWDESLICPAGLPACSCKPGGSFVLETLGKDFPSVESTQSLAVEV